MQKYPRNPSPQQVKLKDMRQSELIGNYKKQRIKSLYDNKMVAMKFKLMGLENLISVKEAKFKKGLMKRIELLCAYTKMKNNSDYSYLAIEPIFTRNTPANELEISQMMQNLTGILSEETVIGLHPKVNDVQAEIERKENEASKMYEDNYNNLGVEDAEEE